MKKSSVGKGIRAEQFRIQLKDIKVSESNPRFGAKIETEELKKNVKRNGLLQAITLRRAGGGYEVVLGSRRFAAILADRGPDGFLNAGEFILVDWDDNFVIRAAVAENSQREDLTVVDAGRFLNRLVARDASLTEEKLAQLTNLGNRQRINELRALADEFEHLPNSWQADLLTPSSRRLGDRRWISLSHYKHVRAIIGDNGQIPPGLVELMEKAGVEHWSANELKRQLDGLKVDADTAPTKPAAIQEGPKAPDYKRVIKSLGAARKACGTDADVAELIRLLMGQVEEIIAAAKKAKPADTPAASPAPAPATDATAPSATPSLGENAA